MSRLEPPITPLTEPFWEGTRRRELLAQRCTACDRFIWYPRHACPGCLGAAMEWVALSGAGSIYTFNVMRKPGNPMMAAAVPYIVALVDLDEGVRMTTNIVGDDLDDLRCDQRVEVDWSIELGDGRRLPTFRPAAR
jgi:uncharacterized OB-fold protein